MIFRSTHVGVTALAGVVLLVLQPASAWRATAADNRFRVKSASQKGVSVFLTRGLTGPRPATDLGRMARKLRVQYPGAVYHVARAIRTSCASRCSCARRRP